MNQTNKKNIAILMGGGSVERKISIKSGEHFCANLDSNEYNAYKILITEKSEWILKIKDPSLESNHVFKHVMILFCCLCKYLDEVNNQTEKLYKMVQKDASDL